MLDQINLLDWLEYDSSNKGKSRTIL